MAKAMVHQGLLLALLLLAFSTLSSAVPDRTARQVPSNLGIRESVLDDLLNAVGSTDAGNLKALFSILSMDNIGGEGTLNVGSKVIPITLATNPDAIIRALTLPDGTAVADEESARREMTDEFSLAKKRTKAQGMRSPAQILPSELDEVRRSASPLHGVLRVLRQRLSDQQRQHLQQQAQQRRHAFRARLPHMLQQWRSAVQAALRQKQQQRRRAVLKLLASVASSQSRSND